MSLSDLKPCPFCGGAPEMDAMRAYRNITTGQLGCAVAIYCSDCGADHAACREDYIDRSVDDLIFMVTEAWNRRPDKVGTMRPSGTFWDDVDTAQAAREEPSQEKIEACIDDIKQGICCPRIHGCEENDGQYCGVRQAFQRAGLIPDPDAEEPSQEGAGEPVAWRYCYVRPGKPLQWKVRQTPMAPSPAGGGMSEVRVQPLFTTPPDPQARIAALEAWEWLSNQTSLSLAHEWERPNGEPDDPGEWVVHRVSGGANDREWTEIASAETPLAAIQVARAALNQGADHGG